MTSLIEKRSSPNAIEFRHVSLSFDNQPALIDVSFALRQGEMIFITGVSGSGKSVLLHLAMGFLKPDSGQVLVAGREIQELDETELLAIRGGLMGIVYPPSKDCCRSTKTTTQPIPTLQTPGTRAVRQESSSCERFSG
jgi:ABC-type ATPase involved in cell division